jgi:hypothetical protein
MILPALPDSLPIKSQKTTTTASTSRSFRSVAKDSKRPLLSPRATGKFAINALVTFIVRRRPAATRNVNRRTSATEASNHRNPDDGSLGKAAVKTSNVLSADDAELTLRVTEKHLLPGRYRAQAAA